MADPPRADDPPISTPEIELATVSIVDGVWQDQPDHVATFIEERLGELGRGRGNLYVLLDVSGEVEGRAELERALIEVIRETYANSRGSISFALSEALRAANSHLYESNRQVAREARRMAGVSAVALRGSDLYIGQAGPSVVYVEANQKLARYPAESDWFVEDAPLFSPEGNASAPLGVRREFACDLAHATVVIGDVFVLATRGLTQLATTQELAIAFTERSAREIGGYLEGLGDDADLTALIAEIINPHVRHAVDQPDEFEIPEPVAPEHVQIEPAPVAAVPQETVPNGSDQAGEPEDDEFELVWDDEDVEEGEPLSDEEEAKPTEPEPTPSPVYTSTAAAIPLSPSSFIPSRVELNPPRVQAPPPVDPEAYQQEVERLRAEREARRAAQRESAARVVGGIAGVFAVIGGALGSVFARTFGAIDWDGIGRGINRSLNFAVSALISLFLIVIRLVLPGAPTRQATSLARRASDDPIWVKALALVLPVLLIGLAGARYVQQVNFRDTQFKALVSQADTLTRQAESNPDKTQARKQLTDARTKLQEASELGDSPQAHSVLNKIQDQTNELDGVSVLYFVPTLASFSPPSQLTEIATSDLDVFMLDRGRKRILHYIINDTTGAAKAAAPDGVLFKETDKVDNYTIGDLLLMTTATPEDDQVWIVAAADGALVWYDVKTGERHAQPLSDTKDWGELRAIDSFGGSIYLLDAAKNQIFKYVHTDKGYATEAAPYFPDNAQVNLSRATSMAIDGDVWVLNRTGTIQRFRGGASVAFQLSGLKTPLKNPTAIYTSPEVDALYVADSGNQRVVVFDKNGRFTGEFKPYAEKSDAFKSLQDLTVNETKRKMYLVNDSAAFLTNVLK